MPEKSAEERTMAEEPVSVAVAEQVSEKLVADALNLVDVNVQLEKMDTIDVKVVEDSQPTTSEAASGQTTTTASSSAAEQIHHVKWIKWQNHTAKVPVVTQNENGPCPLLAVMNVLLLRGQVHLDDKADFVTGQKLMEILGDCILRLAPKDISAELQANYEQNVSDAIAVLPKLMTGLDVNVRFTDVKDFEYTDECVVFDLLNIPLYHGWIVDVEDNSDLTNVLGRQTYNQMIEQYINDKANTGDDSAVARAHVIGQFLEDTASQLTSFGIGKLKKTMRDGELAVFFRNNHFSSVLKEQDQLYLLVTDDGFLHESSIIWEMLCTVSGDNQFVDSAFVKFVEHAPANNDQSSPSPVAVATEATEQPVLTKQQQEDRDYMFALSLQQEQADHSTSVVQVQPSATDVLTPEEQMKRDAELARRLQEAEHADAEQEQAALQQQQQQQQRQSPARMQSGRGEQQQQQQQQPRRMSQQQQQQLAVQQGGRSDSVPVNQSREQDCVESDSETETSFGDVSLTSGGTVNDRQSKESVSSVKDQVPRIRGRALHPPKTSCFQCSIL